MDALEREFPALLADHQPPCCSLYQPTHRHFPEKQQDPIRFRNLLRTMEASLRQNYAARDIQPLLAPFVALAEDFAFWRDTRDGLAAFATADLFRVYRLQRPVPERVVVAGSFHTKPLLRILQSADRYQILGIDRHDMRLFEGNRDTLDEIEPAPGVPRTIADVVGEKAGAPERRNRVYGPAARGMAARHGTDLREAELAGETERFFRAVDRAVLEHHSRPQNMPLLLAALPENDTLFRRVSRNPFLLPEGLDVDPDALSLEALRERAWQRILPHYLERLGGLVARFHAAKAKGAGADDPADIAAAAAAHRIDTLLIEAERHIPGTFDPASGAIGFVDRDRPAAGDLVDDVLDDLGEHVLKTGGAVVLVPRARMPTETGLAAIYRY